MSDVHEPTAPTFAWGRNPAVWLLMVPIRAWRLVSTRMPPRCRFEPSCSAYALEALQRHGPLKGSWLAARRLGRCHPWNLGGFDPVPPSNVRSHREHAPVATPTPRASAG